MKWCAWCDEVEATHEAWHIGWAAGQRVHVCELCLEGVDRTEWGAEELPPEPEEEHRYLPQ